MSFTKSGLIDSLRGFGSFFFSGIFDRSIPAFWPLIGGPGTSAAVGAGALAVGAGLIAAGKAIGGKGDTSVPSTGGGGSGGGPQSPADRGLRDGAGSQLPNLDELFRGGAGASGVHVTVNITGPIGNPRRAGAEIIDAAREAATLEPFNERRGL